MGKIKLKNLRFYAYHGCLPEETKIGSHYLVNVVIKANTTQAEQTDNLAKTVDYAAVYEIIKGYMAKPSKLLEHQGKIIASHLLNYSPLISKVVIKISKQNPPLSGESEAVVYSCALTKKICAKNL